MPADNSHHQSLFETPTEGMRLTNGACHIELVNSAAERMSADSNSEIIGPSIELLIPDKVKPDHNSIRKVFYHNPFNWAT